MFSSPVPPPVSWGADVLIAMSSKEHVNSDGAFDADEQRGIEALAAAAVAARPENERVREASRLAGCLVKHKEMRGDAAAIERAILEQAQGRAGEPLGETHGAGHCRGRQGAEQDIIASAPGLATGSARIDQRVCSARRVPTARSASSCSRCPLASRAR